MLAVLLIIPTYHKLGEVASSGGSEFFLWGVAKLNGEHNVVLHVDVVPVTDIGEEPFLFTWRDLDLWEVFMCERDGLVPPPPLRRANERHAAALLLGHHARQRPGPTCGPGRRPRTRRRSSRGHRWCSRRRSGGVVVRGELVAGVFLQHGTGSGSRAPTS